MNKHLSSVCVLVKEYDEAIAFYTVCMGFELIQDTQISDNTRFVLVRHPGTQTALLLTRAESELELSRVGQQAAGRVFMILNTDDFQRDHQHMRKKGVTFIEAPRREAYGKVAIFEDLYGNLWDLLQPAETV